MLNRVAGAQIAQLLADHRGVAHRHALRGFSVAKILIWARAHHQRTGKWPKFGSGPIPEARGETWAKVDNVLWYGIRGLPGNSSLPRLLVEHYGAPLRLRRRLPRATDPDRLERKPRITGQNKASVADAVAEAAREGLAGIEGATNTPSQDGLQVFREWAAHVPPRPGPPVDPSRDSINE